MPRVNRSSISRPDAPLRRAFLVVLVLVLWMVVVACRLVYLQSTQHEFLSRRARSQQQGMIETAPMRGLVLDRAGRELARSIQTESFFAVPDEIDDIEAASQKISSVLGISSESLVKRLKQAQNSNRKFEWIARRLDEKQADRVRMLQLEGIHSLKEPKRFYPHASLAAHVLGFAGMDEVGLGGVEQFYDDRIKGEPGRVFVETDARRRSYEAIENPGRAGHTVVLTIDQVLQYRTERALAAAVNRARARSGSAVVLDPRTGEILALANAPSFDPNKAANVPAQKRANEALQNIYEPGSTFKIVPFAAAIEERLIRPDDKIDCLMGSIKVAGRVVRDHSRFGTLTITDALAKSSNVAAIKLGIKVGDERMAHYMKQFGFGLKTGVELPGETSGLLRPVASWQPSSIGSLAIGQEIGVTPLQMASAFATIANDGVRVAPRLVKEIRNSEGITVFRSTSVTGKVVSAETARTIRGMLEAVTLKGTAKAAQIAGYTAAGKTGTAQKIDPRTRTYSRTKHVASFVGFAPVENPAVVIIVVIDEPAGAYHGGQVAAPVFREIAEQILPDLIVPPDREEAEKKAPELVARATKSAQTAESSLRENEKEDAASKMSIPQVVKIGAGGASEVVYVMSTARAALMPDLRGRSVRDVARICSDLGLELEALGEGKALRQSLAPGTEIEAGQVVRVDFRRSD